MFDLSDSHARQQLIAAAHEGKRLRATRCGPWEFLRFHDSFKAIPEGSTVFDDTLIFGYPKIGRIVQLEAGIKAQFTGAFWAEEKIDGYNVRIVRRGDALLALTRRGFLCPFTTDRLVDLLDTRIFQDHPELVLCAEVAGPDNPYNEGSPPFIAEDVQLFVFDIMRCNQPGCLPYREKLKLLEDYGLPSVPRHGHYRIEDSAALKPLLLQLDTEGREGIVMKEDSAADRRAKYVTGRINISDIRVNAGNIRQLPPEYFMHRILRLALFFEEHDLALTEDLKNKLGAALLEGMHDTLRQYRERQLVYRTFRCRFRQRANAELMLRDLRRRLGGGQIKLRQLQKAGDYYLLEFDKLTPKTKDHLDYLLRGGLIFD